MKRILFVKLGAIGDVVMAMAAVHRLLQNDPHIEFTWVCGKTVSPLISKFLPQVKRIEVNEGWLLQSHIIKQCCELLKINLKLVGMKWDLIVTAYRDRRYRWLSLLSRSKQRRWIQDHQNEFYFKPGIYHADAYYMILSDSRNLPEPPINCGDLSKNQSPSNRDRIALAPGGAKNLMREDALRRYPIEHYRDLARSLIEIGRPPVILGAESDEWTRPYFLDLDVEFELGSYSLVDLCEALKDFDVVISHDSGIMHLALMMNTRVIALFGPTRSDEKVPRNLSRNFSVALQSGQELKCSPCYDGRNYAECSKNECLQSLSYKTILNLILSDRNDSLRLKEVPS